MMTDTVTGIAAGLRSEMPWLSKLSTIGSSPWLAVDDLLTRLEALEQGDEHDLDKCLRTRCVRCGQKACAHFCHTEEIPASAPWFQRKPAQENEEATDES